MVGDDSGVIGITQRELLMEMRDNGNVDEPLGHPRSSASAAQRWTLTTSLGITPGAPGRRLRSEARFDRKFGQPPKESSGIRAVDDPVVEGE
jgi:hypothetical protein